MLLKSLRLKNIRSYSDEHVVFPQGIVLLAGDIGAGKSTILLAIEFALFGLLRGDLSGAALLRNGAREGLVELAFEIDGKDYVIGRTLKRSKTSVEQDAGYIVEQGLRREATAIELKTTVLDVLGYPQDLVSKSKSLIYRYTVYTPQEDMKKIILEDKESRLMILRKVFDIDKYKRIADNASTYAKLLRERKRLFEGQLADEPVKKQQFADKQLQAKAVQQSLLDIQPRLHAAKQGVLAQKAGLERLEAERATIQQHRIAFETADAQLKALAKQKQQAEAELQQLAPLLAGTPPVPGASPTEIAYALQQKQGAIQATEMELRKHIAARADLHAQKHLSQSASSKIIALSECPTCLQHVPDTHKHHIVKREEQNADALLARLAQCENLVRKHEHIKTVQQQELVAIQQQQASVREQQLKVQQFQLNQQRKTQVESRLAEHVSAINAAEAAKQQAATQLQSGSALETQYAAEKNKLDLLQQQERVVIVEHATLLEKAKAIKETLDLLSRDLAGKQDARQKLDKLNVLHQWMGDFFGNLMTVMEKHVMTKVYHEFNGLFQQWFSLLIEDDVLVARLDEEFSPLMQQNGYDSAIENLSGGEKTACALAYRLALNKVITAVRSTVRTKDLVILDEPTDGFSQDQLGRMRDVLDQLRARQIILVSHEQAIESLADHVLRVVKEEHASKVVV